MTLSIAATGRRARPAPRPGDAAITPLPPPSLSQFAADQALALTRFAYLVCGDRHRAEDLVQDAFVSLYRRFGDLLPVRAPIAYARRAIVNAHLSRVRVRAGHEQLLDEIPERPGPESTADPAEADLLWAALRTLAPRQRTVLVLRYYIGCDDTEIAELIEARAGTVRSLASRALAELRTRPEIAALLIEEASS